MKILGIDIGGTKTTTMLFKKEKNRLKTLKREKKITRDYSFKELIELIREKSGEADAIAISSPGFIQKGIVVSASNNKNLEGKKFSNAIKRMGKPFAIYNDADCFVYAEASEGAGKSIKNGVIAGWIFGTGIGGGTALKINGKTELFPGINEAGHMIIPFKMKDKLLESSTRIRRRYRKLGFLTLEDVASGRTREELGEEYKKLENEIEEAVVYGFYNVQKILSPKLHIIGGGYGKFLGKNYFARIEKKLKETYEKESHAKPEFSIKMFKLSDDIGAYGAALLFLKDKKVKQ